jgi:hypothetical protein
MFNALLPRLLLYAVAVSAVITLDRSETRNVLSLILFKIIMINICNKIREKMKVTDLKPSFMQMTS